MDVKPPSTEFRLRLEAWRRQPTPISAAEVVETAIVEGDEANAISAAWALTSNGMSPTPLLRAQARRLLERRGEIEAVNPVPIDDFEKRLSLWRHRTRDYPADALAWIELARLQVVLGSQNDAKRSVLVARQLAPNDRHVIRSATRLFLHLHQAEVAHDVLRRCEATRHDPWLTAAEIAIASHRNKAPQLFKVGLSFFESDRWRPGEINELAAAVGTTFLLDGNRKRGRKMIARGLADPTGNTLAQAVWITQALDEPVIEASQLRSAADANEAKTLSFFKTGEFSRSLNSAREWIDEEPFSNRAHITAVAAASAGQQYTETIVLADRGLRYDPGSVPILNNKVFALACLGNLDEADRLLASIRSENDVQTHVGDANRGLIAFRRSLNDTGIQHYRLAIAGFRRANNLACEQIALAYLAREAVRANDPQSKAFIDEAERTLGNSDVSQAKKVLGDAKVMFSVSHLQRNAEISRQRKPVMDKP
jgi:hypothetical protein